MGSLFGFCVPLVSSLGGTRNGKMHSCDTICRLVSGHGSVDFGYGMHCGFPPLQDERSGFQSQRDVILLTTGWDFTAWKELSAVW